MVGTVIGLAAVLRGHRGAGPAGHGGPAPGAAAGPGWRQAPGTCRTGGVAPAHRAAGAGHHGTVCRCHLCPVYLYCALADCPDRGLGRLRDGNAGLDRPGIHAGQCAGRAARGSFAASEPAGVRRPADGHDAALSLAGGHAAGRGPGPADLGYGRVRRGAPSADAGDARGQRRSGPGVVRERGRLQSGQCARRGCRRCGAVGRTRLCRRAPGRRRAGTGRPAAGPAGQPAALASQHVSQAE